MLAGGAVGAAALLAACSSPAPVVGPPAAPAPSQEPVPLNQPVTVQRMKSDARGTDVDLVLIVPSGVPATGLPVCLALHGRGANARNFLQLGVQEALSQAVRNGTPPFAIAAVDGDHYWVNVDGHDDPQRMLTDEVPGWLARRNLRPTSAVLGISMGGFGALRFARDHPELKAIATASAALFVSWPDAKSRDVFASEDQWRAHEPLLHTDAVRADATGIWCGTSDPFLGADKKLIRAVQPDQSSLTPGAHNDDYWRGVMPAILKFVGEKLG